jgi:hypothetical protein
MQYQSIEWLMLAWRRQKQKTAMAFPESALRNSIIRWQVKAVNANRAIMRTLTKKFNRAKESIHRRLTDRGTVVIGMR